MKKKLLESTERHFSCKEGGASYRIPKAVENIIAEQLRQNNSRPGFNQGSEAPVVSSSEKYQPTNHTDVDRLELLADRLRLGTTYKLGANNLLDAWRNAQTAFASFDSFCTSIEHLAFYVGSDQAEGIKHPKAWMLSQLRQGYYPAPAGYVSWEERITEAEARDSREKRARLKKLRIQKFEDDFAIWFEQKSDDDRRALLKGSFFTDPNSKAAKDFLRQKFCAETGRTDPCAEEEEAEAR